MSLRLIKPGASVVLRHPKTGNAVHPLYTRANGTQVWPVLGASSDDPDDPSFTGEGGSEDDEDDDEGEEDDEDVKKPVKKTKSSRKKDDDEDEDDDDDDEDHRIARASRQAKRYRLALRAEETKNREMAARLKALEDKDKKPDEVSSRDLTEAREKADKAEAAAKALTAQLAFFKTSVPGVTWADASDAFALAEREGLFDDVIDEDGTVDARELRRGLKDLAKRKPHLVKSTEDPKASSRKATDEDDNDDEDENEPRSPRPMNGNRRGKKGTAPSRAELAKKFPVLNTR